MTSNALAAPHPLSVIIIDRAVPGPELHAALFGRGEAFIRAGVFTRGADVRAWLRCGGHADLALVEMELADCTGADAIRLLRQRIPRITCVAYTHRREDTQILAALRAGAEGYLLKDTDPREVALALRERTQGRVAMSGDALKVLMEALRREGAGGRRSAPAVSVTEREADVLMLLAKGMGYAKIGRALGMGLGTVQSHIKRLYAKLEVNTKAEAALAAADLGLV